MASAALPLPPGAPDAAPPPAHRADELTGLATRVCLLGGLTAALEQGNTVAVLFCDLDDFKFVNDGLGHGTGDRLLVDVAARLRAAAGPSDPVARMGGDEFAVLCREVEDEADALARAQALRLSLEAPFDLAGRRRRVRTSIGCRVAHPAEHAALDAEAVLRDADVAMYQAKGAGKDRVELFSACTRAAMVRRLELEHELEIAVRDGGLALLYQPQVDLVTGRMVGVEALARWPHPRLGSISPGEFVPLAEQTGLIGRLGAWVFDEACRQLAHWQLVDGLPELTATVNVSVHQLADPDFVDQVEASLAGSGVRPSSLCVELTETALMDATEGPLEVLRRLKALGLYVAIDDFGTGYSSLGALKRLPVEVLKVDRSFVDGLGTDPESSAIVASVLSLAHAMGLHVIAEGVETPLQAAELLALGCTVTQGFLYSPAVPADAVPDLLARPAARWATAAREPARASRSFIDEMLTQIGIPGRSA